MVNTTRTSHNTKSPSSKKSDISAIQAKLARRFLYIFLGPLAVVLALGAYAYHLSDRLTRLEVGEQMNVIERVWAQTHNLDLVINEYEQLTANHDSPQTLARLGGLYYTRASSRLSTHSCDTTRAIEVLARANTLALANTGHESWLANRTLAGIYVGLGREHWPKAIEAGEKALQENKYDSESYNNLAWVYAMIQDSHQDLEKAKVYAEKAVRLTQEQDVNAIDTLVAVYLARQETDLATHTLKRLLDGAEGDSKTALQTIQKKRLAVQAANHAPASVS